MVESFGWEGWFTIVVITLSFIVLLMDKAPADFVMLLAVTILMTAQIITTSEGLAGFSNTSVMTVAILYVVAAGVNSTGALDYFFNKALGHPKYLSVAQTRLMVPVGVVSAFLNNTPVVAIMIPIIQRWARKIKMPVSQFFIPLSFASMLGGTCTLIGTSTNLVIAGVYQETYPNATAIGLFDLGTVGVPTLLTGFGYIILFAPVLLPGFEELERRSKKALGLAGDEGMDGPDGITPSLPPGIGSDFTVACIVTEHSDVVGKAVDEAEIRGQDGLYLTSVQRGDRIFNAVGPEFVINEQDMLFFTGLVDKFNEFCIAHGFQIITDANEDIFINKDESALDEEQVKPLDATSFQQDSSMLSPKSPSSRPRFTNRSRKNTFDERIIKVVVRSGSYLENKTAKEAKFRTRYDAAILSLFRAGQKQSVHGNLGRIALRVGDVLLIVTGNTFSWDQPETDKDLKPYESDSVMMHIEADERKSMDHSNAEYLNDAIIDVDIEREFLIPMRVIENPKLVGARSLVGQSIEEAGLRGLPGLFLVAIERTNKQRIEHVVGPDAILEADDVVWFAGEREAVSTLRRIPGLESTDDQQANKLNVKKVHRRLVECVLSLRSHMVGKTVREARFRTKYEAAIIAVHRQGRRVLSKIGDIELRAGDVLILDTGPNFVSKYKDDKNFLLVTEIDDSALPHFDKFYIALAAIIAMLVSYLAASDYITLFEPAVFASGIMLVARCITPERARAAVSWDVIVIIACAFGLSTALQNTGVATTVGQGLVTLAELTGTGWVGILSAIYLATFLLSIVLANAAAALLMFNIALESLSACPANLSPTYCESQLVFILMLSASSSYSSPYGYQTNTMVLNCGNYVFRDFLKFGFPLQFWQMAFSVVIVYYMEYWYYSWLITGIGFILLVILRITYDSKKRKNASKTLDTDDGQNDKPIDHVSNGESVATTPAPERSIEMA